jgi:hypothetical protein
VTGITVSLTNVRMVVSGEGLYWVTMMLEGPTPEHLDDEHLRMNAPVAAPKCGFGSRKRSAKL